MRFVTLPLFAVFIAFSLLAPPQSQAVLITVDFSFYYGPGDPVTGNKFPSGSFSFDSSLLQGPGWVHDLSASSVSFAFAGHTFRTDDTTLALNANPDGTFQWEFDSTSQPPGTIGFNLAGIPLSSGIGGYIESETWAPSDLFPQPGTGTYSVSSASEPAVVTLLGLGLVPLKLMRRHKRS